MPIFDVYLTDPKANPFSPRPTRPVFRGIKAEDRAQVKSLWEVYRATNDKFKDMEIDEIREIL